MLRFYGFIMLATTKIGVAKTDISKEEKQCNGLPMKLKQAVFYIPISSSNKKQENR